MSVNVFFICLLVGVVGPLFAGMISLFAGRTKGANTFVQSLFAASSLAGLVGSLAIFLTMTYGALLSVSYKIPVIGITMAVDGMSMGFFALIQFGVFFASLFAIGYLPKYAKTYNLSFLNFVSALFIVGMQLTVLSWSVFAFLFFWEVMSVSAYFLVVADHEETSLKAGFIYFVMTHLGMACLLAGFLILAKGNAAATFGTLMDNARLLPSSSLALAFFLLFAGFGSKAGLVPLHQWLPYAHPQAPSHSSALMSGVMLKVALYGFLRVSISVFPNIPLTWAVIVAVVGLLSAFFGVLSAAVETDLKRLLAWSSIENLGLIFAMIGIGFSFRALGLPDAPFFAAALLHALNHAIFKSGLFLAAGAVISETHTRHLDEMGGLAKAWPALSVAFLGLVFAAAALPPFGTFYGEWVLLQGLASNMLVAPKVVALLSGVALSVTALVGGLAIFTFAKTFAAIFLSKPRTDHALNVKPLARLLVWPVVGAALISLSVGFFATPIVARVGYVGGMPNSAPSLMAATSVSNGSIAPVAVFVLFVALLLVAWSMRRIFTNTRPVRITDTWDCGQPLTPRMEYTATGFAAPIRFFFRSILLSRKAMVVEPVTPGNPWIARRRLEWSTQSIWEEWVYRPVASAIVTAATFLKRLQNGVIQFYILLILATLIAVLLFAL